MTIIRAANDDFLCFDLVCLSLSAFCYYSLLLGYLGLESLHLPVWRERLSIFYIWGFRVAVTVDGVRGGCCTEAVH